MLGQRTWLYSHICCVFLYLLTAPIISVEAEGAFDAKNISATWRTTGASREARRGDFNRLFDGLADTLKGGASIPIQFVVVGELDTGGVGEIASRLKIYRGLYPEKLTRLYCLLNVAACDVENNPYPLRPGQEIILPDFKVEETIAHQPYEKVSDESLESVVVKRGGCDSFDDSCRNYVLNLNIFDENVVDQDELILRDNFAGEFIVPTLGYTAQLAVQLHSEDEAMGEFIKRHYDYEVAAQSADWANPISYENEYSYSLTSKDPLILEMTDSATRLVLLEQARAELTPNLLSQPVNTDLESLPSPSRRSASEPLGPRKHVLELIGHPFITGAEIPEAPEWMHVGVLDGWVDDDHCEFEPGTIADSKNDRETSNFVTDETCGQTAFSVTDRLDHGTHVLSIISAKKNGLGGPGAYPYVHVVTNQVIGDRGELITRAHEAIKDRAKGEHHVLLFNFSITYSTDGLNDKNDPLADEMTRRTAPLYVISAGNQGISLGPSNCSRRPPCLAKTAGNLINVAALTNDEHAPKLLEYLDIQTNEKRKSNYGPYVHVGVPADGVIGAVSGHRIAKQSGSSTGTPFVTAAVAMYMAKHGLAAQPERVRDRIVTSSDLFPELPPDIILGGRLNVTRMLDDKYAYLQFVSLDGTTQELAGILRGDLIVGLSDVVTGARCYTKSRNILRLHRTPAASNGPHHIMLKHDPKDPNYIWALNNDHVMKDKCHKIFPPKALIRREVFIVDDLTLEFTPIDSNGGFGIPELIPHGNVLEYVAPWKN